VLQSLSSSRAANKLGIIIFVDNINGYLFLIGSQRRQTTTETKRVRVKCAKNAPQNQISERQPYTPTVSAFSRCNHGTLRS
jgi:hypothetical protein